MNLRPQSREVVSLEAYRDGEVRAGAANALAYSRELALCAAVFHLMQECFASLPCSDRPYWRVLASLTTGANRYFASAVQCALRGAIAESAMLMRCVLECVAYFEKIHGDEALAVHWVRLDELPRKQRNRLFGTDSELMRQPRIRPIGGQMYSMLSLFGSHARAPALESTIDFEDERGWRLRFAETHSDYVRFMLLAAGLLARDAMNEVLIPLCHEGEQPSDVQAAQQSVRACYEALGNVPGDFMKFVQDPGRPREPRRIMAMHLSEISRIKG